MSNYIDVTYYLLLLASCLLPIAYCLVPLSIAYCVGPTAYCLLPLPNAYGKTKEVVGDAATLKKNLVTMTDAVVVFSLIWFVQQPFYSVE